MARGRGVDYCAEMIRAFALACPSLFLAACAPSVTEPEERSEPVALPAEKEKASPIPSAFRALGTEPFWGANFADGGLTYTTPETPIGTRIMVERKNSVAGTRLSGTLDGIPLVLDVAVQPCSDGMSDRTYPFTATLRLGAETRRGCAYDPATFVLGEREPALDSPAKELPQ